MSIRYPQLSSDPVIGDHGHVVGAFSNSGNSVQEHTIWRHEVEPAEISETHPTLSGALERAEYDIPPPGSPPHSPTRSAIGNTNGILGAEPDRPSGPRRSIFNNIFGVLRRNHYEQVSMESTPGPAVGGGTANDGVFANMAARPQKNVAIRTSDGRVHMVPEDAVHELPPSYAQAQRDRVPGYEPIPPTAADIGAELLFDDLPSGSWMMFLCSAGFSFLFQIVGFIINYLLHTTHAQKYGARLGFGMTLIQFGLMSFIYTSSELPPIDEVTFYSNGTASYIDNFNATATATIDTDTLEQLRANYSMYAGTQQLMAILIMMLGTIVMSHSLFGFWRVKLLEASLKEAAAMPAPTLAEIRHARTALETVYRAFGVDLPVPHDIESGGVDNTVPTGVAHDLRAEAARDHAFRSLLEESLFLCPETTEDLASTAASPLETPEVVRDFSANEER